MTDVALAQSGDLQAFERLVERWKRPICAITLSITKEISASEDVAQEVFVAAWQKLDELQNPESIGPWLRQVARNKALTFLRSTKRREARVVADTEAVETASASDTDEDQERRRLVQDALERLPDDTREVMVLFYREGESVKSVASLLELSEAAVKKRLSRARQALRDDVLPQLQGALLTTAPAAAFVAGVMGALAPGKASAATVTAAGASAASSAVGAMSIGGALLAFVGYRLTERVTQPHLIPLLRRGRNLTVGGFLALALGIATGTWIGMSIGFFTMVVLVTYVQVFILPIAFEPPDGRKNWGYRIGMGCGLIGLGLGLYFGLRGWLIGAGWWAAV